MSVCRHELGVEPPELGSWTPQPPPAIPTLCVTRPSVSTRSWRSYLRSTAEMHLLTYLHDLNVMLTGLGLWLTQDRSERVLRGQTVISNSLPIVACVGVIAGRQHWLHILLVSFPANVCVCRRARVRERRLRWRITGRQLAAKTGSLVRCLVRHLRRRVA